MEAPKPRFRAGEMSQGLAAGPNRTALSGRRPLVRLVEMFSYLVGTSSPLDRALHARTVLGAMLTAASRCRWDANLAPVQDAQPRVQPFQGAFRDGAYIRREDRRRRPGLRRSAQYGPIIALTRACL